MGKDCNRYKMIIILENGNIKCKLIMIIDQRQCQQGEQDQVDCQVGRKWSRKDLQKPAGTEMWVMVNQHYRNHRHRNCFWTAGELLIYLWLPSRYALLERNIMEPSWFREKNIILDDRSTKCKLYITGAVSVSARWTRSSELSREQISIGKRLHKSAGTEMRVMVNQQSRLQGCWVRLSASIHGSMSNTYNLRFGPSTQLFWSHTTYSPIPVPIQQYDDVWTIWTSGADNQSFSWWDQRSFKHTTQYSRKLRVRAFQTGSGWQYDRSKLPRLIL